MSTHSAPEVVLADGDEASGMASMLAGLLEDNVRDFAGRARIASKARGSVVLRADDRDVAVTVSFLPGRVEVRNGAEPGVTVVAGDWLAMAGLCSGQLSPLKAVKDRDLAVKPGKHLPAAAVAGFVLSVPESFYDEEGDGAKAAGDRNRQIAIGAGAAIAGLVVVAAIRRRRRRRR